MDKNGRVTRRCALKAGLGMVAAAGAGRLEAAPVTPAVGEGPFFPRHDQPDKDADLTRVEGRDDVATGDVVELRCRVVDEEGLAVAGALVDLWQANAHGRYDHEDDPNPAPLDPNFQGRAQLLSDDDGRFFIRTIKPGPYPVDENWSRPPHLHFKLAKRGYHELVTQMFFAGEALNDTDRLLASIPEARRDEVLVRFRTDEDGVARGEFTLVMGRVQRA